MNDNRFFYREQGGFTGGQGDAFPHPVSREENGYLRQAQSNDPRRLDSESFIPADREAAGNQRRKKRRS